MTRKVGDKPEKYKVMKSKERESLKKERLINSVQ